MKIELTESMVLDVAEAAAKNILRAVLVMHERRVWGQYPFETPDNIPDNSFERDTLREIQRAVRSIADQTERRFFVLAIGHIFRRERQASGTEPKWQDYVARCKKAYAESHKKEVA